MFLREPEVLAATLNESGAEPNGAIKLYSVLTTLALFFCGPSSPSVASSAADVLPGSAGFLRGLPRGRPVDGRVLVLEDGLDGWETGGLLSKSPGRGAMAGEPFLCGPAAAKGTRLLKGLEV